jgi:large subunit ribosomal protein L4
MPRKALQVATRMALAARLADDEVKLVDKLPLAAPKTAAAAKLLSALGLSEHTVLFAPEKHDDNLWKSFRNIDGVSVSPVADLNAWSILRPRAIVMTTAAIDAFRATVKSRVKPVAAGQKTAKRSAARRKAEPAAAKAKSTAKPGRRKTSTTKKGE